MTNFSSDMIHFTNFLSGFPINEPKSYHHYFSSLFCLLQNIGAYLLKKKYQLVYNKQMKWLLFCYFTLARPQGKKIENFQLTAYLKLYILINVLYILVKFYLSKGSYVITHYGLPLNINAFVHLKNLPSKLAIKKQKSIYTRKKL